MKKLVKKEIFVVLTPRAFNNMTQDIDSYSYEGGRKHLKETGVTLAPDETVLKRD
ncbi:hypothetical protein ACS127_08825 [Amphibacillus sp. Q70]|uniref:hypothetical protein n=1 Tax=Amphibacillus sp. Q70 TaxID=3453416 RepID=UPI003F844632